MRVLRVVVSACLAGQSSAAVSSAALPVCPLLLAHRGDTRVFPANTVRAFEASLGGGFDGIELDVQFSADRVAIVSHDDNLAVATTCRGKISETAAAELERCVVVRTTLLPESRLIARSTLHPQKLPRLHEALNSLFSRPHKPWVVIDIKPLVHPQGAVGALRAAMPCKTDCGAIERRITFISQNQHDAKLLRKEFRESRIALESNRTVSGLIDDVCPKRCPTHWNDPNIDTYSISFGSLFDPKLKLVKLIRGENMTPKQRFKAFHQMNAGLAKPRQMLGWTINGPMAIGGLHAHGFDQILTDLPAKKFWEYWRKSAPPGAPACS